MSSLIWFFSLFLPQCGIPTIAATQWAHPLWVSCFSRWFFMYPPQARPQLCSLFWAVNITNTISQSRSPCVSLFNLFFSWISQYYDLIHTLIRSSILCIEKKFLLCSVQTFSQNSVIIGFDDGCFTFSCTCFPVRLTFSLVIILGSSAACTRASTNVDVIKRVCEAKKTSSWTKLDQALCDLTQHARMATCIHTYTYIHTVYIYIYIFIYI
jgi:hypothetical protein